MEMRVSTEITTSIYKFERKKTMAEINRNACNYTTYMAEMEDGFNLLLPFGLDEKLNKVNIDLSKSNHILIGGVTGSGKSVCLNVLITSLIEKNSPNNLKLVLIDPKKVEMSIYKDIPHLLCPIITEPAQAKVCLDKLVDEMERRYDIFAHTGAKDIHSFNTEYAPKAGLEPMPFIVVFIDEYANLVDSVKVVSDPIAQIVTKASAAGIHLIMTTQRPCANIITATIKANLDVHVALRVQNAKDSKFLLGKKGAEELKGQGDALISSPQIPSSPIHVQLLTISNGEIKGIIEKIKTKYQNVSSNEAGNSNQGIGGEEGKNS